MAKYNTSIGIELDRFFFIARDSTQICNMFSPYIDDYWHQLEAEDINEFQARCLNIFGCEIEHRPATGCGEITWIADYERLYGKLPDEWFMDKSGCIQQTIRNEYHSTGIIRACWDCHPFPGRVSRPQPKKDKDKSKKHTPPSEPKNPDEKN